jgi:hypothetical protein
MPMGITAAVKAVAAVAPAIAKRFFLLSNM